MNKMAMFHLQQELTLVWADTAWYLCVQIQAVLIFVCGKTQILLWSWMPREWRGVPTWLTLWWSVFPPLSSSSSSSISFSSSFLCFRAAQRSRGVFIKRVVDRVPVQQLLLGLGWGQRAGVNIKPQPTATGRANATAAAAAVWRD